MSRWHHQHPESPTHEFPDLSRVGIRPEFAEQLRAWNINPGLTTIRRILRELKG